MVHRRHRHPGSGRAHGRERDRRRLPGAGARPVRAGRAEGRDRQPDRRREISWRSRRPAAAASSTAASTTTATRTGSSRRREDPVDQGVHGLELRGRAGPGAAIAAARARPDAGARSSPAPARCGRCWWSGRRRPRRGRTTRRRCTRSSSRAGLLPDARAAALRRLRVRPADVHARHHRDRARLPVDRLVPLPRRRPRAAGRLAVRGAGAGGDLRRRRLPLRGGRGAGRDGDAHRRRLGAEQHASLLVGRAVLDALHGPDVHPRTSPTAAAGDPALRRAARASGRCSTTGATRSG